MSQITNDAEFKQALNDLDAKQQRVIAAIFVQHVLSLSNDERVKRAVKVAADESANADELSSALKSAKAAVMESSTRCGAEGNWTDQAGYFVTRAAVAVLTPQAQTKSSPAWQAAASCRMARTSIEIDSDSDKEPGFAETKWQYGILSKHLNA